MEVTGPKGTLRARFRGIPWWAKILIGLAVLQSLKLFVVPLYETGQLRILYYLSAKVWSANKILHSTINWLIVHIAVATSMNVLLIGWFMGYKNPGQMGSTDNLFVTHVLFSATLLTNLTNAWGLPPISAFILNVTHLFLLTFAAVQHSWSRYFLYFNLGSACECLLLVWTAIDPWQP